MNYIKSYPYIVAIILATIFSIVAWYFTPNKYSATTKLGDEFKETDLAIGLNDISAKIRDLSGCENSGINDIEVYCKTLKTEDFARILSKKNVPVKGMTYGEYLACKDTINMIKDNIEYNISTKHQTLTIQFTDRDPVIAAQMLDSIVVMLQNFVTQTRHNISKAYLQNAKQELITTASNYHKAQKQYANYMDSHIDEQTVEGKQNASTLQNNKTQTFAAYQKATIAYARQKALFTRNYMSFAVIRNVVVPQHSNKHFIGYLLFFNIFSLVFVKAFMLYRQRENKQVVTKKYYSNDLGDIFAPWTLSLLIWSILGIIIAFSSDIIDPIQDVFYTNISVWLAIFTATSISTYLLMPANQDIKTGVKGIKINITIFNILFFLSMIMTPLYMYQIYKIVTMFDSKNLMNNMRELAVNGNGHGFLNYTMVINQALLLTGLWRFPYLPKWKIICVVGCCLAYAIANMEKLTFFLVFITIFFVLFERRIIKLRTIVICGILLIIGFYIFNLSRSDSDSDYQKNTSILDFLGMYLMSPPVAFGHLRRTISDSFCSESLWTIYAYTNRLMGSGSIIQHEDFGEFVYVPMPTNVYTIMKPFYQDLGTIGVAFYAFIYGLVTGFIYRKARNGNAFGICMYTYLVFVLTMQFFDELIFVAIPQFLQRMFLVYIICQNKIKFTIHKSRGSRSLQIE